MADLNRVADIRGLALSISDDGSTVLLGEGSCFLPSGRRLMTAGTTAAVSASQPVGLLHAYAMEQANNTLGLELSATGPDAVPYRGTARTKNGDPTRRYLGSGRIETVGKLRSGRHLTVGGRGNEVTLWRASTAATVPVPLLSLPILALTAPAQQTMNLSTLIPITASAVDIKVANLSNLTVYLGVPTIGALGRLNRITDIAPNNTATVRCLLDADRSITLLPSATGLLGAIVAIGAGNVQVEVMGYVFDR